MHVAITGASGFVGSNLTKFLQEQNVSFDSLNLRTPEYSWNIAECDSIVHLAGKAHDIKKIAKPEEYYLVNTELTKRVFEMFATSNAKIFIMLSSVKAVRDSFTEEALTEIITPQPKTDYGKSKLLAEEYILNRQLPDWKKVFILRPCMIHGPGNKGNLNLLYKAVQYGLPYPLGSFDNLRSFLSIENLCFVIKQLIENSNIPSGVYHIADDHAISTKQLIELIGEVLQRQPKIWNIPPTLIRWIAQIGDALHLPLNTHRLNKLTENYIVCNQKIKSAIGSNLPLISNEGLKKTIASFDHAK